MARAPSPAGDKVDWKKLEAVLRERLRVDHYAYCMEQTYLFWIRCYVAFHDWRKPSSLGADAVRAFLRYLAMERDVAASTQNQAPNVVVFWYKKLLKIEVGAFSTFPRAREGQRVRVVASRGEIKAVIEELEGRARLMGCLVYAPEYA